MKVKCASLLLLLISFNHLFSQSDYSLGVSFGYGMNIYRNSNSTDKNHFTFKHPFTANLSVKLIKNMDENNKLFAEVFYTRKKIEFEYNLNEPAIPFKNREIIGQSYDCISLYVGYRKVISGNALSTFIDLSFGADYNTNVLVSNKGNGQAQDELDGTVFYENYGNTNLGEKSYTLSSNIGAGLIFGTRNQYEIGAFLNFPFYKIQADVSGYQYIWKYEDKQYVHQLNYKGQIYYPSIKVTYYIF